LAQVTEQAAAALSAYYHAVGLASLIMAVTPGANAGAVVQFGAEVSIWNIGDLADPCVDGAVALMTFCACEG
jgi:L-arabinose isomerase